VSQHAELTPERWSRFTRSQQIIQIGVEMHRGLSALTPERFASLRLGYERVLRLTDLTAQVNAHPHLRRELLRWRGLVAELYLRDAPDPAAHRDALKAVLTLDPVAYDQIAALGL
jgi:hypothetical protein